MTSMTRLGSVVTTLLLLGCSGNNGSSDASATGGAPNSGGQSSASGQGGSMSTGGTSLVNSGGALGLGGAQTSTSGSALGGNVTSSGGSASGGAGATGGASLNSGGGSNASGGPSTSTGGTAIGGSATTGGSKAAGGTSAGGTVTGGSASVGGTATGGALTIGGRTTGGAATVGGATNAAGGTPGAGGASGTCSPPTCGSHNWACWRMPNPAGLGLPNAASYTDLGDGTVRDNVTCLVWQKANLTAGSTNTFTFADAQTACSASTVAGKKWRTATRVELTSIVDFSKTSGVAVNTTYFTALSGYTWTATPWVVSQISTKPQDAWMINFADGLTSNGALQSGAYYTRCVNSGDDSTSSSPVIPPNQYATVASGEIQDNYTGLIWQQDDSVSTMTQPEAVTYCANLGLNGHSGWRLASIHEIATLVDDNPPITKVSPAINQTLFPTTAPSTPYWTSSLYKGQAVSTHAPWTLSFTDGFTNYNKTAAIAKCVR